MISSVLSLAGRTRSCLHLAVSLQWDASSSYTTDETDSEIRATLAYAVTYPMSRQCNVIVFTCSKLEKFCRRQSLITVPLSGKTLQMFSRVIPVPSRLGRAKRGFVLDVDACLYLSRWRARQCWDRLLNNPQQALLRDVLAPCVCTDTINTFFDRFLALRIPA
jgi:hypothetical protein